MDNRTTPYDSPQSIIHFANTGEACTLKPALDLIRTLTAEGVVFIRCPGAPGQGEGKVYDLGRRGVEVYWFTMEPGAPASCAQFRNIPVAKRPAQSKTAPLLGGPRTIIQGGRTDAPVYEVSGPRHLYVVGN